MPVLDVVSIVGGGFVDEVIAVALNVRVNDGHHFPTTGRKFVNHCGWICRSKTPPWIQTVTAVTDLTQSPPLATHVAKRATGG